MLRKKQKLVSEFHSISDSESSTDFEDNCDIEEKGADDSLEVEEQCKSGQQNENRAAGSPEDLSVVDKIAHCTTNIYLTKLFARPNSSQEWLTLNLLELFDPLLGTIEKMVQFSYLVDVKFLIAALKRSGNKKIPILILHGCKENEKHIREDASRFTDVVTHLVKMPFPFGTHHTKMMIIKYREGLRVVVLTANLVQEDWLNKTQGIWISPLLMKSTSDSSKSDSVTGFKKNLIKYLSSYNLVFLKPWMEEVKCHDFSSVKVHLIMSVPGRYLGSVKQDYGHLQLRKILKQYQFPLESENWPVVSQCSSIGTLGNSPMNWFCGEFKDSLTCGYSPECDSQKISQVPMKLIFPCVEDVRNSYDGYLSGGSLPYSKFTHAKQEWLRSFMNCWASDHRGRTHASPHIKSYTRISLCHKKILWFLLTSANVSKAAWGQFEKSGQQFFIRSYELGVLFIPQEFGKIGHFQLVQGQRPCKLGEFNLPYDIPLKPYDKTDEPWLCDKSYRKLDSLGEKHLC